jgi:2'-5' RNA ligase
VPGNEQGDAIVSGVGKPPQEMRVFLGVKIAPDLSDQLARLAKELREEQVKFVSPGDIHLTLVPPWNEMSIDEAIAKMRVIVSKFGPFALELRHLIYGPEARRPRLLWAECAAPDEAVTLRGALLDLFGQNDDRPFRPHVTLARLRGNGATIARRHPIDRPLSFVQYVESVELFRSPPAGATGYQVLASAPLAQRASPASSVESTPDADQ